jgi:hypothetical protein
MRVQILPTWLCASLNVWAFPKKISSLQGRKSQSRHVFSSEDFSFTCWQCLNMNIRSPSECIQMFCTNHSRQSRSPCTLQKHDFLIFVFHLLSCLHCLKQTKVTKMLFQFVIISTVRSSCWYFLVSFLSLAI